jgi:hypothetical protein
MKGSSGISQGLNRWTKIEERGEKGQESATHFTVPAMEKSSKSTRKGAGFTPECNTLLAFSRIGVFPTGT